MDYATALQDALTVYQITPTDANREAVFEAVNAYRVFVGELPDAFLAKVEALPAGNVPTALPTVTVTADKSLPWLPVLAIGAALIILGGVQGRAMYGDGE